MHNWLDLQVKHEQQQDWLRAAWQRRLIAEARACDARVPAATRLGYWLTAWRRSLKAWFWTAAARPALKDH